MITTHTAIARPVQALKTVCAALLLAGASLSTQAAALFTFEGVVDSGSLTGSTYTGSFGFEAPAADFDGSVDLSSFTLNFFSQTYTLADADASTTPVAVFSAGQFVGVDFIDADGANPALRPFVYLTAGFTDLSEASFAYDSTGGGPEGFGNFAPTAQVAEPASLGLALAGLGGLLAWRRRSAR